MGRLTLPLHTFFRKALPSLAVNTLRVTLISAFAALTVVASAAAAPKAKVYKVDKSLACYQQNSTVSASKAAKNVIKTTGGGILLTEDTDLVYVAFGKNNAEASAQAAHIKQVFGLYGSGNIVATKNNVAYWTNADHLSTAQRQLVLACLR